MSSIVGTSVSVFRRAPHLRLTSIRALERAAALKHYHGIDGLTIEDLEYQVKRLESELQEKNRQLAENEALVLEMKEKSDPRKLVKRLSIIGLAVSLCALAGYWTIDVLIVSPALCLFAIVACLMTWTMAALDERADRQMMRNAPTR